MFPVLHFLKPRQLPNQQKERNISNLNKLYKPKTRLYSLIHYFKGKPKQLFLADGLGALLTSVLLIALLATFNESFGMPLKAVYILASVAFVYFVYSISCYLFLGHNWKPYLKLIAFANLLYCCATITLVVFFYQSLTTLGVIYFIAELIVMGCLIIFEFMMSNSKQGNNL